MNNIVLVTVLQALVQCCLLVHSSGVDYCDEKVCDDKKTHIACKGGHGLCPVGIKHIGCNPSFSFGLACGGYITEYRMTDALKHLIVEHHNFYRNMVASGQVKGFPKAARMGQMFWDDELATLAAIYSRQCQPTDYRQCHNTRQFRKSGQNFLSTTEYNSQPTLMGQPTAEELIEDGITAWFEEYKNGNETDIGKFGGERHAVSFMQMMNDRNIAVGCALVSNADSNVLIKVHLMICNYARRNTAGSEVYETSATAGSKCMTGTDRRLKGLCTKREEIDPNI